VLIPWPNALVAAGAPDLLTIEDDGTWHGPITFVNSWSADTRMLASESDAEAEVRPLLPLPVNVQFVTAPRHDGAVTGLMSLDEVWRESDSVMGRGRIDMEDPFGPHLARKIRQKFLRFVSADLDKVEGRMVCVAEDGTPDDETNLATCERQGELYTRWRIMGATLVAHPAYPLAAISTGPVQPQQPADIAGYDPVWGCVRPNGAGGWEPADCGAEDAVPAGPSQDQPYDLEHALPTADTAAVAAPATGPAPDTAPTHAGLALKAANTGRILLIQRALDERDPAAGTWEFPGGGIEEGETPEAAAFREFAEETGIQLPDTVQVVDGWRSPNGVYQGYVAVLPAEQEIDINPGPDDRDVSNPDDPDGDITETVAWWDIGALPDMPALRPEARDTPWDLLAAASAEDPASAQPDGAMAAAANAVPAVDTSDNLTAAAVHIEGWLPPTDWFRSPDLTELQPITVDPDGRVRGYLAAWGVAHRSFPGRAVTPPHSPSGYALFNSRPIHTSEGLVDVGLITMGTGHAALGLDRRSAVAHYDDTGTIAAVVRAGEDSRGIWLAGAVLPDLGEQQRLRLSLSRFSGDWRQEGDGLELVAALAVPTEGFPVPVKRRGNQGDYALVAAGALPAPAPHPYPRADLASDIPDAATRLAQRAELAAARVHALRMAAADRSIRALANRLEHATS